MTSMLRTIDILHPPVVALTTPNPTSVSNKRSVAAHAEFTVPAAKDRACARLPFGYAKGISPQFCLPQIFRFRIPPGRDRWPSERHCGQ